MRVLIIDDLDFIRETVADCLKSIDESISIDFACNGEEGLRCVSEEDYNVIFVDYDMPVMNGITFLSATVNLRKDENIKTVLMTSDGYCEYLGLVKDKEYFGVDVFLKKPFKFEEIEGVINERRVIEERTATTGKN